MSRLKVLIDELCPDGVEYKRLADVGTLIKGKGLQKKDFVEEGVGCIHYGQIYTRLGLKVTEPLTFVSEEAAKKFTLVEPGDLVLAITSENVDDVCKAVVWMGDAPIVTGAHAAVFHHQLDPVYVGYLFQTHEINRQKVLLVDGVKVIEMKVERLAEMRIPVPPIEVQREIVRVLDAMQELDDALESELERRDDQLWQLRNRVYSDGRFELKPLGSIGKFERGRRFTRAEMNGTGVGCVHYGDIYTDYKYFASEPLNRLDENIHKQLRFATRGDVIIAATSENAEDVCTAIAWLGDEDVAIHDDCQKFCHDQNPLYMAMFFNSGPFIRQKQRFITESKVVRVAGDEMAQIEIPLPPRDAQDRIAHAMLQSIYLTRTIEGERSARRKQFEYYRDKLLDFPEKPDDLELAFDSGDDMDEYFDFDNGTYPNRKPMP